MSINLIALCCQWTSARQELSAAVDKFQLACESFSSLSIHVGAALESAQPDFLLSIETDLPLLPQEALRITRQLKIMEKLRNASASLVPINRLPSELLAAIFSIAVNTSRANRPRGADQGHPLDFLNVLSSVSSYWRNVSLSAPALWAEITLTRTGGLNHAALWLERSRSCPLHLRSLNYKFPENQNGLIDIVGMHSGRFRSLVLRSDSHVGQQIFYNACERHDEASSLELLATRGYKRIRSNAQDTSPPPKHQMDKFLASVRALYVDRRLFDGCYLESFCNLTTLSLSWVDPGTFPNQQKFLNVLRASPMLCSLELYLFELEPTPQPDTILVHLPKLKTMSLRSVPLWFARWLVQSIIPYSGGLTLTLDRLLNHRNMALGFEIPFSIPDNIEALRINSGYSSTIQLDLSGLLKLLTRLKTLALDSYTIEVVDSTLDSGDSEHRMLTALELVRCEVADKSRFKSMVAQHSVRQLRMSMCQGCPTEQELLELSPNLAFSKKSESFLPLYSPFD